MSQQSPQRPQYDASQNTASHDASAKQSVVTENVTSMAKDERVAAQGGGLHVIAESAGGQVHNHILIYKNSGFCGVLIFTNSSKHMLHMLRSMCNILVVYISDVY